MLDDHPDTRWMGVLVRLLYTAALANTLALATTVSAVYNCCHIQ